MEALRADFREKFSRYMEENTAREMDERLAEASREALRNSLVSAPHHTENVYYCKAIEILRVLDEGVAEPRLSMPSEKMRDLRPDIWQSYVEKDRLMRLKEENMATTDYYKCPKCKHRRSIVTQVQTRSADEPATTLVKCVVCGHTISF